MIPSKQLISRTSLAMKDALHKPHAKNQMLFKRYTKQIVAVACLFTVIIASMYVYKSTQITPYNHPDKNPEGPMTKVQVNISGEIEEVSEDGMRFRLGDKWYMTNENTEFAAGAGDTITIKFEVGKYISGYSSSGTGEDNILVDIIYLNHRH